MPFTFVCPFCHHRSRVDDRFAGQSGPCINCGKSVTMPAGKFTPAQEAARPATEPAEVSKVQTAIPRFIRITIAAAASVLVLFLLYLVLAPWLVMLREQRNVALCRNNLQRIALALRDYESQYGTLPPPFVTDSTGKLLYSWRILILPQLGHSDLYESFDRTQPWDSPKNLAIAQRMPIEFASPASIDSVSMNESNYTLITGPNTLFPPSGPQTLKRVTDSAATTIIVAETKTSGRNWASPGDLDILTLNFQINGTGNSIGGNHREGATVGMVDGSSAFLPNELPGGVLKALITPRGGESVDTSTFKR